jgi:hypothetical protein
MDILLVVLAKYHLKPSKDISSNKVNKRTKQGSSHHLKEVGFRLCERKDVFMKIYEKWTLQVSGEEELLLFDGFAYHNEGYDRLHQLCNDTCITTPEGRKVWLDSFLFFNE